MAQRNLKISWFSLLSTVNIEITIFPFIHPQQNVTYIKSSHFTRFFLNNILMNERIKRARSDKISFTVNFDKGEICIYWKCR
jgi:hypothetical protein